MVCEKCGKRVDAKSVDIKNNKCPFCGNYLIIDAISTAEVDLTNAIRYVINEFGEDIILQKLRFLSLLGDVAPDFKKERKILSIAMNEEIADLFLNCSANDREITILNVKKKLGGILSESAIEFVVFSFTEALGWNYVPQNRMDNDNVRNNNRSQYDKVSKQPSKIQQKKDTVISVKTANVTQVGSTINVPSQKGRNGYKSVAVLVKVTIILGVLIGSILTIHSKHSVPNNSTSLDNISNSESILTDSLPNETLLDNTESEALMSIFKSDFSIGYNYNAAITREGDLYTWGVNEDGQLGDKTTQNRTTPKKILENVECVELSQYHGAAITIDGDLYTWGKNDYGQLGDGTKESRNFPKKIMENVSTVVVGQSNTAAITTDGILYTWGKNSCGVLGDGTVVDRLLPTKVMDNVVNVYLNSTCSAAITTDSTLYMWGANESGQIGDGSMEDKNVPTKILSKVKTVTLGDNRSAAITTNGSLFTWGSNGLGLLGDGSLDTVTKPKKIMDNISFVEMGRYQCMAISTTGALFMWGKSTFEVLGGSNNLINTPSKIMDNVVSVSLGSFHCAAVTYDGRLYTWGTNDYGQLGNETEEYGYSPFSVLDNVVNVKVGMDYTMATTTDGHVFTWGRNDSGQLGDGTTEDKCKPTHISLVD